MFCPKCRLEYKEGITICPDCGSPLVKELTPEPKPKMRKLYEVFSTWKTSEISFIQSLLEANRIQCFVENLYYPSMTPVGSAAVPIKIMVEEKDKDKAKEIVNQYYKDIKENKNGSY